MLARASMVQLEVALLPYSIGAPTILEALSYTDWAILLRQSLFGAMIEVLQAIPVPHRDSDWHDWLADTIAVGAVLIQMRIGRARDA